MHCNLIGQRQLEVSRPLGQIIAVGLAFTKLCVVFFH